MMKRALFGFMLPGLLALAAIGCQTMVGSLPGTGGATGSAGADGTGTGGAGKGGVGGSGSGTGGVVGAGGATVVEGVGGETGAGGTTGAGTGGKTGSGVGGGAVGTGGATGAGGGATGTGGGATGAGGKAGTGGATGLGGSTGGTTCQPATCGTHKWACWPMPNPASAGLPNPASYTDLGNGAVLDNLTCLSWEKAPGTTQGYWQDNSDHCASLASSNYAGRGDWRLPTRVEMASIVDYTRTGDAINTTAFPKEPSGYYRTGSDWYETITGQNTSGFSWIYGMSSGFTSNAYAKTTAMAYVRCVAGNGAGEAQGTFAVAPPNQYTVATGEVTDNYTGLIWQQTDSATPAGATGVPWASAANYCSTLGLNGHTWRVPSINELATLVNEALVGPAINRTTFPNTKSGSKSNNWYWANRTYGTSTYGWAINFDDGFTGYNSGASGDWNYFTAAWVRCVR